jgi:lysophospholipase L1-like esterase
VGFDLDHEGHLDWSAEELAYGRIADGSDGIYAWLEDNPSDLVLLHAGSYGLMSSADQIGAILDEINRWEASANGNPVTVMVARIIDQWPLNPDVQAFNEALQALVEDRINNPDNVAYPDKLIMVDLHAALTYPADLNDALHPNALGYDKMAQIWLQALTGGINNDLLQRCP